MDDAILKAEKIAQQLATIAGGGIPEGEQLDVFRTIAKTVQAASKKLFNCPRCNRKFHVSSAKSGRLYKCVRCQTVLAEIPEEEKNQSGISPDSIHAKIEEIKGELMGNQ